MVYIQTKFTYVPIYIYIQKNYLEMFTFRLLPLDLGGVTEEDESLLLAGL